MTDNAPSPDQLMWVLQIVGGGAVSRITGLRDGRSPWLVEWTGGDGDGRAVLRLGAADDGTSQAVAETVMPIADGQGVPVPNVLGSRVDDTSAMLLVEWIDGSSAQPTEPDTGRLEALGAMAAKISRANPGEIELRRITRPIGDVDFAALRAESPHELLDRAARRIEGLHPEGRVGIVHGDLWAGNTLWREGEIVAVLDWDCAGVGPVGLDLGALRLDAAMSYGQDAAVHVLAGWEREAAASAEWLGYWDALAAVNTPPDLGWFVETTRHDLARPDLNRELMVERRDAFLAAALERLG